MIIAGTGHRPKYLPCKYNEVDQWAINTKVSLKQWLAAIKPEIVISGMAIGWDTWLAEAALSLKIPLHSYIPFKEQGDNWPTSSKNKYKEILSRANKVVCISETYHKEAFFQRDEAMVDNADFILALWNPKIITGGTYHTIQYALKKRKEIINFWSEVD
jgi:uncharacterized phage-like protein YoqJ